MFISPHLCLVLPEVECTIFLEVPAPADFNPLAPVFWTSMQISLKLEQLKHVLCFGCRISWKKLHHYLTYPTLLQNRNIWVLWGVCSCWFLLDISFYSQNLFLPNVLTDIGYTQAIHLPANAAFKATQKPGYTGLPYPLNTLQPKVNQSSIGVSSRESQLVLDLAILFPDAVITGCCYSSFKVQKQRNALSSFGRSLDFPDHAFWTGIANCVTPGKPTFEIGIDSKIGSRVVL